MVKEKEKKMEGEKLKHIIQLLFHVGELAIKKYYIYIAMSNVASINILSLLKQIQNLKSRKMCFSNILQDMKTFEYKIFCLMKYFILQMDSASHLQGKRRISFENVRKL